MRVFRFCPGMTVGINFSMLDSDHSCRAVGRDKICLLLLSRCKEVTKKGRPRVIGCSCLPLRSPTGGCGTRSAQTVLAHFPPSPSLPAAR